jgi:hypothetical protein
VRVPVEEAMPFPCDAGVLLRDPRETKGEDYALTTDGCGDGCCC